MLLPLTSAPKHIYASDYSDHEFVALCFSPQLATPLGKGEWRLNISLMDDPMFTIRINHVLDQLTYQFDHSLSHLSKQEKWERVKHKIKKLWITIGIMQLRIKRKDEQQLE